MRTPPPVLPEDSPAPGGYTPTLMDRLGPDGATVVRARVAVVLTFVVTFPIAAFAAQHRALTAPHPFLTGLVVASVASALMHFMLMRMPAAVGAGALAVVAPSGNSTPYEDQYSQVESMEARGDVAGALEAYEAIIAEHPAAVSPRMRAAELYAARGARPARAAELFREIRGIPDVPRRDALYACSRLVDLYDGALDDPGRALVELRRIIELYPGTPVATHARDALPRMKARLMDGRAD
jgi:hypothetical protein